MLPLVNLTDYIIMLIVAAIVGGIGGVGAELLQERMGNTGTVEKPWPIPESHLVDLGLIASVLLGAMAAVAVLYFLPPQEETIVQTNGQAVTVVSYELVKVVALSLIAGSAGSVIFKSFADRLQALLDKQRAEMAVTQLKRGLDSDVQEVVHNIVDNHRSTLQAPLQARQHRTISVGNGEAKPLSEFEEHDEELASTYEHKLDSFLVAFEVEVAQRMAERLSKRIEEAQTMLNITDAKASTSQ